MIHSVDVLDIICSRTFGLLAEKDCRVVWTDGNLYVVAKSGAVQRFSTDRPVKSAGTWKVQVGEAALRFQGASCGMCRKRVASSTGGRMTVEEIVAAGDVVGVE